MKDRIKKVKELAWNKYGVKVKIAFNSQGFDLSLDKPIYYKEQSKMVREIKDTLGFKNTGIYVF